MRTSADKLLGLPVQWVVPASVRRSAADQMLKYGSWATSGTAGGGMGARGCAKGANAKPLTVAASWKVLIALSIWLLGPRCTKERPDESGRGSLRGCATSARRV